MIFNFQMRVGADVLRAEAADLKDLAEARAETARRTGQMLMDNALRVWIDQDWQMDVTNERGLMLFTIFVSAVTSPMVLPPARRP